MSDWNPEHQAAADTWDRTTQQFAHVEKLSADRRELANRAAAIRARDERIAELEAALREIAAYDPESDLGIWLYGCDAPGIARAALAGEEQK